MGRSEDTRQRLFDATLSLIGEKGYAATTVDEIVERAGVAKGTVYYHFKSKAELVDALIAQQPLSTRMRAAVANVDDPVARVSAALDEVVGFIGENATFARLLITEIWREDRAWRDTLMALRSGAIDVIREAVDDGVAQGVFPAGHDTLTDAAALFYMAATTALDWTMMTPERSAGAVKADVRRLALGALSR